MSFSRQPDPARPDRRHSVVRPDRETTHLLHVELDQEEEVVRSRDGAELLRRGRPTETLDFARRRGDVSLGGGLSLAHDYFPFPDGWQADPAAEAEQYRQFAAAVEPARLPVQELPAELVPFVAWVLAEHLADRPRRARSGEPVPGAHLFVFRNAGWQHAASLDLRDSGRATELLRRRVRWERDRGVGAGLLVRVADDGRVTARTLAWIGSDGYGRETANLGGAAATLSAADYRLVTGALELDEAASVLDTPEKLRGLFTAS